MKNETIKQLDQISTDLAEWIVTLENQQSDNSDHFQDILIRLENIVKLLRKASRE